MARIHRLPPAVIDAIAAGETIERPAYVIKELLENAIDAGADSIDITFSQGGLDRIRVYDTGVGMDPEDIVLAATPHATSKIFSLDDFSSLQTLGFRGEALASISKVANVTIASRTRESEVGHVVEIYHGSQGEVVPRGMPRGTSITVEDLFEHVPVRKKFLTNLQSERRLIVEIVTQQALAHPAVGFALSDGNKSLLDLPAQQTLPTRLAYLFDQTTIEQLIPLDFNQPPFAISGYIGTPQLARKHSRHQYITINNRPISFPVLSTVLKKAYGSLLETGFSPWFILDIKLPASTIDPNIHPRKEIIAFLEEAKVINLINKVVVEALSNQDLSFRYQPQPPTNATLTLRDKHSPLPELHHLLKSEVAPWSVTPLNQNQVIQIENTYVAFPDQDGITLLDQHAAHERVLYEQFKDVYAKRVHSTEELTTPTQPTTIALDPAFVLQRDPAQDALFLEQETSLQTLGFAWEDFGPQSYSFTQIPAMLEEHDLASLIPQVLDDVSQNLPLTITNQTHRTLAYLACRSAIMAGDSLSTEQAVRLITQLAQTPNNATCPHGRPTRIHFDKLSLEKLFHRRK